MIYDSTNLNIDKIISSIDKHGISIIRDYLSEDQLSDIISEFYEIPKSDYPFGKNFRMERSDCKKYKNIYSLFSEKWMDDVTKKYIKGKSSSNAQIFGTHDYKRDGMAPNGILHFDRVFALKFFVYLTNTSKSNGAFEFYPNTHKLGQEIRNRHISNKVPWNKIPNHIKLDYPEIDLKDPICCEAIAGTMIIFDASGFHKGGLVLNGERKVIRGHSRTVPLMRETIL